MSSTAALRLERVSVRIAGTPVLRQLTADFAPGSTTAIVGRNGAGKTTLLRLLMGFLPGHEGRVLLGGQDLAGVPARRRAVLGVGYAPEQRGMFPSFNVAENLRFPCETTGLSKIEIDRRLAETLTIVPELEPMLPRSGAALSGGQGKMAALGRAIMVGTRLILLDEPFQGLAPVLALHYGQALARLVRLRPELCILVTESNRSLLRDIPDRTLVLERGAIA